MGRKGKLKRVTYQRVVAIVMVIVMSTLSADWNSMVTYATTTSGNNVEEIFNQDKELSIGKDFSDEIVEVELEEERTENSTTYELANGFKKVVYYSAPVRYKNDKGVYVDYDASLKKVSDATKRNNKAGYSYENKEGNMKNYFPQVISEETPVLLEYGEMSIGIVPLGNYETISKTAESIEEFKPVVTASEQVTDIYDVTSEKLTSAIYTAKNNSYQLEYKSLDNGIKENIILNKVPESNVWQFEITLSDGIVPVKDKYSKGITFLNESLDVVVGAIDTPYMDDATGQNYSEEIIYEIEEKKGKDNTYILSMIVDEEYLYSEKTVYPVTIDPSYTWSGSTSVHDVYVLNGTKYRDLNFYSTGTTGFYVGRTPSYGLGRTYLSFDGLADKVKGKSIASAKATVYETGTGKSGLTVQAYKTTESYSKSSVTWNNRPGYATLLDTFTSTAVANKARSFDISSYVKGVANGGNDYGILLKTSVETNAEEYIRFYGSRHASSVYRPKLTVTFYDKPTAPTSVKVNSTYLKKGSKLTVNWAGINSVTLSKVQYQLYDYDMESATLGSIITSYNNSGTLGSTSSGSKTIAESANWSEGEYRIYLRGYDSYGGASSGKGATFVIDGTVPQITKLTMTEPSASRYLKDVPSVTWKVTDKYFKNLQYRVNDGSYVALSTAKDGTAKLAASYFTKPGKYKIDFRAADKAGNFSAVQTKYCYYDATAPVVSATVSGKETDLLQPVLSWVIQDETLSSVQYSVNGGEYKQIGTAATGSYQLQDEGLSANSTNTIRIKAIDKAGNSTEKVLKYFPAVNVDATVSPVTSLESYANILPVVEWSGLENVDVKLYVGKEELSEVEISGEEFASGLKQLEESYFEESGEYTIQLEGVTPAGDIIFEKEFTYYYDQTAPVIAEGRFEKATGTVKLSVTDDIKLSQEAVYVVVPSNVEKPEEVEALKQTVSLEESAEGYQFKIEDTQLNREEGIYKIFVAVKDAAGNHSAISEYGYYLFDDVEYDGKINISGKNTADYTVELNWNEQEDIKNVALYVKEGSQFCYEDTITEGAQYVYEMKDTSKVSVAFRILVTYQNGKTVMSNILEMVNMYDEDVIVESPLLEESFIDTDFDGLFDVYELWDFNTNIEVEDTDGDGFGDHYEVFVLNSNPAVFDQDKDSDGDGLTNKEEQEQGTNPWLKDSDFDGIGDSADEKPMLTDVNSKQTINYDITIPNMYFDIVTEKETYCSYYNVTKKTKDTEKKQTYYVYDSNINLVTAIQTTGKESLRNTYTYEEDVIKYVVHNNSVYSFEHDENGNLNNVKVGDVSVKEYFYDDDHEQYVAERYGADSLKTELKPNDDGKLSKMYIGDELIYELSYNAEGKLEKEVDHLTNATYEYSYMDNQLAKLTINGEFTIEYSCTSKTENDIEVSTIKEVYTLNGQERSTVITNKKDSLRQYHVSEAVLVNGNTVQDTMDWDYKDYDTEVRDNAGKIILGRSVCNVENNTDVVYSNGNSYQYVYDNDNLIQINQSGKEVASYEYDDLDRLVRENDSRIDKTYVYSYDNSGNMLMIKEAAYTKAAKVESFTKINQFSYSESNEDQLEKFNDSVISYTESGRMKAYNGYEYSWMKNTLSEVTSNNGDEISYFYNKDGYRTKKIVNGTETDYYLENSRIIWEKRDNDIIWYLYNANGEVIGFEVNGTDYYYIIDALNSVIGITDHTGEMIAEYVYDSWGNIMDIKGNKEIAQLNAMRYRGYYYDNETGLYYLQARYYNPELRRFISMDDVENLLDSLENINDFNLYQYAASNPIKNYDPSGEFAIELCLFGVALVIFGLAACSYAQLHKNMAKQSTRNKWDSRTGSMIRDLIDDVKTCVAIQKEGLRVISLQLEDVRDDVYERLAKVAKKPNYKTEKEDHHIVPWKDNRYKLKSLNDARKYMKKVDIIPKTDSRNRVMIKTGLHRRLHTKIYEIVVSKLVVSAYEYEGKTTKKAQICATLLALKGFLKSVSKASPF